MEITKYKHQEDILVLNPFKHLLCFDTGTGKTLTAIWWANQNNLKTLVIVPKALKKQWQREVKEHGETYFDVITKEEFRRDWDKLPKYDGIIVDEAHYFSGIKSQMSKNLLKYIKKQDVPYVWLLTATPFLSTPWNIYRLAQILGYKWNYKTFEYTFFVYARMGNRMIPVVKKGIEVEIADLVRKIGTAIKIEDCFDVPEQTFLNEHFTLTAPQKKGIKTLKEEDMLPIVRYGKQHQIENGTLKGDEYNEHQFFKADKHDRLMELVEGNKKIAIFCCYNLQIDFLKEQLKKTGRKVLVIRGKTKDRDSVVQEVEQSDDAIVLINSYCSEGYELPSVGVIVYASLSHSYKDYKQSKGRFLRGNKLKKNVYIHLVNEGTIDEAWYESVVIKKQNFDIEIYSRNDRIKG